MENLSAVMARVAELRGALAPRPIPTDPAVRESFAAHLDSALRDRAGRARELRSGTASIDDHGSVTLGHMLQQRALGSFTSAPASSPATGTALPLDGHFGSGFGTRIDPFTGEVRMHRGQDISAPSGTPIVALAPGEVTFAGDRGGFGLLVVVDHGDGLETYYAHQSRIDVAVGDRVAAGDVLGAVGSTGRSTGPHLHFEVRRDGEAIDPAPYLEEISP